MNPPLTPSERDRFDAYIADVSLRVRCGYSLSLRVSASGACVFFDTPDADGDMSCGSLSVMEQIEAAVEFFELDEARTEADDDL